MSSEVNENILPKIKFQRFPPCQGTELWKRKIRTAFRHFDTNKDGILTAKDFEIQAELLVKYNNIPDDQLPTYREERLYAWHSFYEKSAKKAADGTLYVTEEDFVNNASKHLNGTDDALEKGILMGQLVFKAVDADKNGTISHKEFANFCKAYGIPEDMAPEIFATIDLDGDGVLSREEFAFAYVSFFQDEDPNCPYNNFFGPLVE